jgi:hypothetical protein
LSSSRKTTKPLAHTLQGTGSLGDLRPCGRGARLLLPGDGVPAQSVSVRIALPGRWLVIDRLGCPRVCAKRPQHDRQVPSSVRRHVANSDRAGDVRAVATGYPSRVGRPLSLRGVGDTPLVAWSAVCDTVRQAVIAENRPAAGGRVGPRDTRELSQSAAHRIFASFNRARSRSRRDHRTDRHRPRTISRTPNPNGSSLQQDRHGLVVGDLCTCLELQQSATADGVLDPQEGITRKTEHAGNIARRHLERFGAQHHRSLAELFETNAVVQTAR